MSATIILIRYVARAISQKIFVSITPCKVQFKKVNVVNPKNVKNKVSIAWEIKVDKLFLSQRNLLFVILLILSKIIKYDISEANNILGLRLKRISNDSWAKSSEFGVKCNKNCNDITKNIEVIKPIKIPRKASFLP